MREKTAVEKELDRLYAEGIASNASDQTVSTVPVVDQLSSRLETADRERDEALNKRDSVLNQIARNDLLYVSVGLLTVYSTDGTGSKFSTRDPTQILTRKLRLIFQHTVPQIPDDKTLHHGHQFIYRKKTQYA